MVADALKIADTILKVGKDIFGIVSNVSDKRLKRQEKVRITFLV